jgi:hypothetical protein
MQGLGVFSSFGPLQAGYDKLGKTASHFAWMERLRDNQRCLGLAHSHAASGDLPTAGTDGLSIRESLDHGTDPAAAAVGDDRSYLGTLLVCTDTIPSLPRTNLPSAKASENPST